jgi:hypothetical protein
MILVIIFRVLDLEIFESCDKRCHDRDDELSLRELCDLFCVDRRKRDDCNGERRRERNHKHHRCDDDCRDDRVDRRHDDCCWHEDDFDDDCDLDLDIFGCDHHRRSSDKKSRTPFNRNGCNGCSW